MRLWETASLTFFIYTLCVSAVAARSGRRRIVAILAGSAGALLLTLGVARVPYTPILHDWIAPPALLLLAYWLSGLLFVAHRPRQEQILCDMDRRCRVATLSRRTPRPLAEILELAYLGVYPLIPVALILHLFATPDPDPERFWAVLLITDYICFGALAWVQTRPPRSLESAEPWRAGARAINLRLLGVTSVQVNTFPSGHAAEALAAALLVFGAPWPIVAWMFVNALAISAGAVLGRYHYAADALAGWVVAVLVWAVVW